MSITKVSNFVLDTNSVTLDKIAVVSGTNGQVLSTDGNGNLLFVDKLVTEDVQDIIGGLLNAGTHTNITVDYNDINNTLSLNASGAVTSVNTQTGAVVLDTDDISEGTNNLYYTQARFDAALGAKSTTDVSEGSNLYYTDTRSRNAISASGSLSYNSSTGELSYTERTDSQIRSLFTAGTGVSIANGEISIGQDVSPASNVVFNDINATNDVLIDGDLTVSGTTTTVFSATTRINENILYLNEGGEATITGAVGNGTTVTYTADNTYSVGYTVDITGVTPSSFNIVDGVVTAADATTFTVTSTVTDTYVSGGEVYGHAHVNADLGWVGAYDDGTYAHTGLFRDATDGLFKIFDSYTVEPSDSASINISHASYNSASMLVDNLTAEGDITATNISGDGTNITNVLTNYSTDDLSEGLNLYYTSTRANDDFDTRLSTKSTTDLSEGTNLYFTDERVDDRVATLLSAGTNITLAYNDNTNQLTISSNGLTGNTTDNLDEGTTNLYYTDARARASISVTGDLTYNSSTGVISTQGLASSTTDDLSEGTTNLYFTDERVDDRVASLLVGGQNITVSYDDNANTLTINGVEDNFANNTTDDLSEGTTNLYYTDDRVEALLATFIVINDTSEFGNLVWNETTGQIDHYGVTSPEIRNLFSATRGIEYDNITGEFELDTSYSPTFNNLTLNGDLTVSGTTTTVNTQEILLADNVITLNSDLVSTSAPSENAGFEINRGSSSNVSIRWNETTDKWQFTNDGVVYKDIGSLSSSTTDELSEGTSNLYFTDERAQDAVAGMITAGSNISVAYDDVANTFTITGEVEDDLSNNTTSDLAEGTNLYFTDERVDDRVSSLLVAGDNITITYDDNSNSLRIDAVEDDLSNNTTSDLAEGTNLYYTDTRTDARVDILRTDLETSGDAAVHFENLTNVPTVVSQTINGTGASLYSLNATPGSAEAVIATISGVMQTPGSDYVVSGSNITFTTALPVGQAAQLRFIGYQIVGGTASNDLPLNGGTMSGSILVDTDNSYDLGSATEQFRTVYAHNIEATYADLAERYASDTKYAPGTVLVFGGEAEVTTTTHDSDVSVAGVVSTEPALKMNSSAGDDDSHPYVALRGRVPCQVIGPVTKGDLLVTSSTPGFAKSIGKNDMGRAVFAKAIETNLDNGKKLVEVVIV